MKILALTDGGNWCLDKLTDVVVRNNPQHSWKVLAVHPKNVAGVLPEVEEAVGWADIVWHQYFRTAAQLQELLPAQFAKKIHVLTQHNQKDKVFEHDFKWVNHHVCHTTRMQQKLKEHGYDKSTIICHGIDLDFFDFDSNPYEQPAFSVGYAGRTKPWKRLGDISRVCSRLGVPMVAMGRKDDAYAHTIDWSNIDWHDNIPDDDRFDVYKKMSVFVNFSESGIEEGPMPLLEAMASGVPVITTPVGEAEDIIQDGKNGLIVNTEEDLEHAIKRLKEYPDLCKELRENAWNTIKNYSEAKMAIQYERLFNQVFWPENDMVSVVVPTFNRPKLLLEIIDALSEQTYPAIELVVVDDDVSASAKEAVQIMREKHPSFAIKYILTGNPGYGLARARNLGAIEAQGHYLLFLDDRYSPRKDAVQKMVEGLKGWKKKKAWVFGDKGANKKTFVENFSCIRRRDFFDFGMFNERITLYGGMSQECRTRALHQGFDLGYIPEAKAKTIFETRRMAGRRSHIWKMKHLIHKMGLGV